MKILIKIGTRVGFLIIIMLLLFTSELKSGWMGACGGRLPEPQLVFPLSEEVDMTDKDSLEFIWLRIISGTRVSRYDFRLYKGYTMTESTLIIQKTLSGDERKISVDSKTFENGQVYTWSLRLQVLGSGKSDRSYHSFKVIKSV